MAHFDDFNGACFSIQHARIQGSKVVEFVVIDNSAASKPSIGGHLATFCGQAITKYVPAPHINGTSATRNAVFANATADIVICMDCHVLLPPGAEDAVIRYFSNPDNRKNIVSGPMLNDHLVPTFAPTHFSPQWSAQMWGRWGVTWLTPDDQKFTVLENQQTGLCEFRGIAGSLEFPETPDFPFPTALGYAGHEQALMATGCRPWMATAKPDDTVEIPGMGLGCFAVWRENWLGFHESATGFGAEELCVHELYRQNGGKAECLAGFQWWHRFFRGTEGAPYQASVGQKVRNYVLWYDRLGLDKGPIKAHFVDSSPPLMVASEWERLVADPVNFEKAQAAAPVYRSNGLPVPADAATISLEGLQHWTAGVERDFNRHVPFLAQMAAQCNAVAEFSGRRESTVALLSCVGEIHSYNDEGFDILTAVMRRVVQETTTVGRTRVFHNHAGGIAASLTPLAAPVDLLFLDTLHTGERITQELQIHSPQVRRWIAIHDTVLYGENGDGGSGMIQAIEDWIDANSDWFVMRHTSEQYGFTVLGRDPAERPASRVSLTPPGPGTELKAILKGLGITLAAQCDCRTRMNQMNAWGSAGCRENLPQILAWMEESKARWGMEAGLSDSGVGAKLAILTKGLGSWEGWKIGMQMLAGGSFNAVEAVVKLAISRAEAKGL